MKILIIFSILKLNEIPSLFYPTFVSSSNDKIYVSCSEGIGIFNKYNFKFLKGFILEKEPKFVFPDEFTGEIYIYFKDGELISIYENDYFYVNKKGIFPGARSFSVTPSTIKIEFQNNYSIYDKFSMIETDKQEASAEWWGEKSILRPDNSEISFLSPFFYYNEDGEKIEYVLITKDKDYYFVCTNGEGVIVYSKNFWRKEGFLRAGASVSDVRVIKKIQKNKIVIAGVSSFNKKGIVIKEGDSWKRYDEYHYGINARNFYSSFEKENILFLAGEGKILVYRNNSFKTLNLNRGFSYPILSINFEAPFILASSKNGVSIVYLDGGVSDVLLKGKSVYAIGLTEKYILLGTLDGLYLLKKNKKELTKLVDKKLYLDSKIKDIKKLINDTFFILSERGILMLFEKENKFRFEYPLPPPVNVSNFVDGSMYIYKNKIFIGTYNNGFWIYDIERKFWEHYSQDNSLRKRKVNVFEVLNDTLFVGTDRGIYLFKLDGR